MATKYWRLSTGGTFSTASNWSTSSGGAANTTTPASGDTLIFDQGSTYTITFTAAPPSVTIVVNNGAVTFSTASYTLTFSSITVNSGSLSILLTSVGTLTINGTGGIVNYGTLYISSLTTTTISNGSGSDVTNYGTLTFTGSGAYTITYGSLYQYGTFTYSSTGSVFTIGHNFILQGSNSISVNGGAGSIYLSGSGSYNIQSSGTSINARLQLTASGTYTLLDSLNITTSTNYSFLYTSGGSLNLNGYTLTAGSMNIGPSASRTIIFNGGSIYLTAGMTSVLFNQAGAGSFRSSSSGTAGYIYFSSSSAKSFNSSASTSYLPNCILSNPGGAGTLTLNISGSTIGGIIGNSTTVVINAGITINVTNPGIIADGNPIALNSSSTTNATLSWVGSGNPSVTSSYTLYHVILFASGTLYSTYCSGFNLYGTYSDGAGGTTNSLIEVNSLSCGYVYVASGSSNFFNFF